MADVETYWRQPAAAASGRSSASCADEATLGAFRKPVVALSLMACDLLALSGALACSGAVLSGPQPLLLQGLPTWLGLIGVFSLVGLYSGVGPSPYERFRLRLVAVASFVVVGCAFSARSAEVGRLLAFGCVDAALLIAFGHYAEAAARSLMIRAGLWGARTALIGCDDRAHELAQRLTSEPELGLAPVGFIATGEESAQVQKQTLPTIGALAELSLKRHKVEVAILSSAADAARIADVVRANAPDCRLLIAESADDLQSSWTRTRTLGSAIGIELSRAPGLWRRRLVKRGVDLAIALPAALLAAPIIGLAALAIQSVDPGPVFYFQERIGRHGASFRVLKLRSMYRDAEARLAQHLRADPDANEEWRQHFKLRRDPRILPIVGGVLRRASVDELPQLWNVICGDMSLVGPRPLPKYHLDSLDSEFRALRARVLPGVTGLWQVTARSDGDAAALKAQDQFYLRNWSMALDAYILLQTLPAVLSGRGAR